MRKALRFLGICLVLAGIGLGGIKLSSDWNSDNEYRQAQQALYKELEQKAASQVVESAQKKPSQEKPVPPREGEALAVLRIPRFGPGFHPVIIEGAPSINEHSEDELLKKGPVHLPATQMPGEIGNFAVAGHRTGWGEEFNRLPELKRGDAIKVDWQGRSYTYHVTKTKKIKPTDNGVILPVPNKPGVKPNKARITLVTCTDRGEDDRYTLRFVVWGELDTKQ